MSVSLPKINIMFRQLAASLVSRSERGIAILIARDSHGTSSGDFYRYTDATQVVEDTFDAQNLAAVQDALSFGAMRVDVARVGSEGTLADALALIQKNEKTGWITVIDGKSDDWSALVSWIKARENEQKSWKAVVYKAAAPDCMHVVNFYNEKVTFADSRGQKAGSAYTPSLAAILAKCNVEQGATNFLCSNLIHVEEVDDGDAAVGQGQFILLNDEDGEVRIGVDVNSLTTTNGETATEDMKYIETVEAMDLMRDDITSTFRQEYLGKYRNKKANQMLLIAAINYYFLQLAESSVLDEDYENAARIDVEAQRAAWVGSGKSEAQDWDDATVMAMPYKRNVYLAGDVKILGSMTNFQFIVTLA